MSIVVPTNSDPETKPSGPAPTEPAPADTDEEPQNALTQKFTEKEWAALKEFRVRATQDSPFVSFSCSYAADLFFSPSSQIF
jgi:hypothetical protein